MIISSRPFSRLILAAAIYTLAGCSGDPTIDLAEYVKEVKNQHRSAIEPLPEFKPYESFSYAAADLRDPFTAPAFSHQQAAVISDKPASSGIKPDFERPTEPLEEFPLDSLRMVGTLEQLKDNWALINDTDGTIHRVQPGNYAGQNHGKITRITDFEVELTEIVPDGIGGWIERQASIAISE
ncbi:MAG TPA: pilus assembly protein PilP [Gammaproteobacteria bacterium]|jgi:type IV pilus assembly protein PilP|nr:pilus assembly protein PilP [Gammaproteobacteria bacterium]